MGEQRQYRNELLDWCHNLYANWNEMKPRFSEIFTRECLEEWEDACIQLQEKLQTGQIAGLDEYQTAVGLFEQWERLYSETNAVEIPDNRSEMAKNHGEFLEIGEFHMETEVEVEHDMDLKEPYLHEESFEMGIYPEVIEVEPDWNMDQEEALEAGAFPEELEFESVDQDGHDDSLGMEFESDDVSDHEEQHRYREELLGWCMNMYSNWENMKPRFTKLFDLESLKEWEGACLQLKDRIEANGKADMDDYQTALNLFEQWEQLMKETYAYQEA